MSEAMRGTDEELAYIKYSAKELLFHQGQQITKLQEDVQFVKMHMVSRDELQATRRWAMGATIAAIGSVAAMVGAVGALGG